MAQEFPNCILGWFIFMICLLHAVCMSHTVYLLSFCCCWRNPGWATSIFCLLKRSLSGTAIPGDGKLALLCPAGALAATSQPPAPLWQPCSQKDGPVPTQQSDLSCHTGHRLLPREKPALPVGSYRSSGVVLLASRCCVAPPAFV